jgi:site-specific DNA recombinase
MAQERETRRVALLLRVSTEKQAGEGTVSLDEQELRCRQFAARQDGWEVVAVYRETFTGTSSDRPEWNRMLLDAGRLDVCLCLDGDRFSRDEFADLVMKRELAEAGIELWFTSLGHIDPENDAMVMSSSMLANAAAYYRRTMLRTMVRGARGKIRDGRWASSPQGVPYGFRVQGRGREATVVADEAESATILRAAQLVLDESLPLKEAAAVLNAEGRMPRGLHRKGGNGERVPTVWSAPLLRRHLTRPALAGEFTWGDGRNAVRTPSGKLKYGGGIAVQIPALISRERFAALLEATSVYGPAPEHGAVYSLSGMVLSPCGQRYTGIYRNDRDLRSYRCQGKRNPPACACPWYDAEPLEDRVWGVITDLLGDSERLMALAREYLAIGQDRAVSQADELSALADQIGRLETQLAAGVSAYLRAGIDPDALAQAVQAQQHELATLKRRRMDIRSIQADAAAQGRAMDQIVQLAQRARGRLAAMGMAEQNEVMRLLGIEVRPLDTRRVPALRVRGVLCDTPFGHPSSIEA